MLQFKIPKKSLSYYQRTKKPLKKLSYLLSIYGNIKKRSKEYDNFFGITHMIEGLEYHFKRHRKFELRRKIILNNIENNLIINPKHNYNNASHEAIAYLNTLGLTYYFFTSKWFKENNITDENIGMHIPSILALLPLRNKIACHRQVDSPNKTDYAGADKFIMLYSKWTMAINNPDPKLTYSYFVKNDNKSLLRKIIPHPIDGIEYFINQNINDKEGFADKNFCIHFIPTTQHTQILKEIISLIEFYLKQLLLKEISIILSKYIFSKKIQ